MAEHTGRVCAIGIHLLQNFRDFPPRACGHISLSYKVSWLTARAYRLPRQSSAHQSRASSLLLTWCPLSPLHESAAGWLMIGRQALARRAATVSSWSCPLTLSPGCRAIGGVGGGAAHPPSVPLLLAGGSLSRRLPFPPLPARRLRSAMAHSKWEYVKKYELDDTLLPGCYIVVRIDGKGFTRCEQGGAEPFDVQQRRRAALNGAQAAARGGMAYLSLRSEGTLHGYCFARALSARHSCAPWAQQRPPALPPF